MSIKNIYLTIYVVVFLGFSYKYAPTIIFYFDQLEGMATITGTNKHKVSFKYTHKELQEDMILTAKVRDIRKVKKLKKGDQVKIIYSKKYPNLASLVGLTNRPSLGGLVLLLVCALPLLLFKNIDWSRKKS